VLRRLGFLAWLFALALAVTVLALGAAAGDLAVVVVTGPGLGRDFGTVAAVCLFVSVHDPNQG